MADPKPKTLEQLKAEWVAAIDAADVACGAERDSCVAARQAAYDAFRKALDAYREALEAQEKTDD